MERTPQTTNICWLRDAIDQKRTQLRAQLKSNQDGVISCNKCGETSKWETDSKGNPAFSLPNCEKQ